ncbi:MAG: Mitochondrial outer membrane protein iml2 [Piccolia ochrophora]|nr:MAG: Mitochondrial outer membrane protein iml2 [Piccolia ochrophora]
MFRMGSWLAPKHKTSTQSLNSLDEPQNLEDALRAATHIMNDDVDAAEEGLNKGNSSFHKLGKGVVTFLKATLGFEREVMAEASERLADAEATSLNDQRRAQREHSAYRSSIYPPGAEFALCNAQCQLMSAVVGVLNESLTESLRGFYKLRKAYVTLDGLLEAENKFMRGRTSGIESLSISTRTSQDSTAEIPRAFDTEKQDPVAADAERASERQRAITSQLEEKEGVSVQHFDEAEKVAREADDADNDDDEVFFDADETHDEHVNAPTTKPLQNDTNALSAKLAQTASLKDQYAVPPATPRFHSHLDHDPDSDIFANPIDVFIHSGSNLCFGLLLLLISMIPPAFGRLLYIIGFKGDRERGIKMIWQASKFHNINGAMSGLILLGYYNGVIGFCDILPDRLSGSINSYPKERCEELLVQMRSRYPKSYLWLLEEARMSAANKDLDRAVELLSGETQSGLKQVEALATFEKSLNLMYSHRYQLAADSFSKLVGMNDWSPGLYHFIAGCCHLELYRQCKASHDLSQARDHAKKAEKILKSVPSHTGRKRFLARQLPFDVFVTRKIHKWEQRAHDWKVDFVDAIGVSPIEEMLYFWNGYKRQPSVCLQASLDALAWSPSSSPFWSRESPDELAIHALLRAVVHRHQGKYELSRRVLYDEVLSIDRTTIKGHLRDDWTLPCACYEMAVLCWFERGQTSEKAEEKEKVRECEEWLEKVAKWEGGYDLDARIGLKITTAQDTLKQYHATATGTESSL